MTAHSAVEQEIDILRLAFGGAAIGLLADGRVCMVRGAVPGERVRVEITEEKKRFVRAKMLEVLAPSPSRIEPGCTLANVCPGCSYLHLDYATELAAKAQQFRDFLLRGAKERDDLAVLPPFPGPERLHWRNKIMLHCEAGRRGYRGEDNVTLVEVPRCELAVEPINAALAELPGAETLRWSENSGVCTDLAPQPMTATLGEYGDFEFAFDGFFQTNYRVAEEMLRRVTGYVSEADPALLLELYCGVGVFSIAAAQSVAALECLGIEVNAGAVTLARKNAAAHGVGSRCRFRSGDAAHALAGWKAGKKAQLLLLDPPRTGMNPALVRDLKKSGIRDVIYVSCAPDTLRRDLDALQPEYRAVEAGLLDMFPGTGHFESITRLRRRTL